MVRSTARLAVVAAALALASAGCGDDGDGGGATTIAAALEAEGGATVTVDGLVVSDANGTYLCDALLESFPPQCGPPAVAVVNLELADLEDVQEAGSVRWSERRVRVTGRMLSGVLTLDGPPASVDGSGDD
jgi:hypothetical protein